MSCASRSPSCGLRDAIPFDRRQRGHIVLLGLVRRDKQISVSARTLFRISCQAGPLRFGMRAAGTAIVEKELQESIIAYDSER